VGLVRTYDRSGALGQGSAFVLGVDGETALVTNQHVVEGARDVTVQFRDGEWRVAEVLGSDVYSDLAALGVTDRPAYARPLSLVDSEPGVGTAVAALGAPFGFGESVSSGIVSGQNRSLPSANEFRIADAVQTDAPINPGNSGGPLVTLDGDVAGVVSAGGGDNVGFAISAALVGRVVPALVRRGAYAHPYMGVQIREVTPPVADANDLPTVRGVMVTGTPTGGPADGRLVPSDSETRALGETVPVGGDVVLALDGVATPTTAALGSYLATETSPGDDLAVLVRRDGRERTVTVTLGTRPSP
jgi:S1-C subfamily serine protease